LPVFNINYIFKQKMLTKNEIMILVEKMKLSAELMPRVEMILRNYDENEGIPSEKFEVICKLIIEK